MPRYIVVHFFAAAGSNILHNEGKNQLTNTFTYMLVQKCFFSKNLWFVYSLQYVTASVRSHPVYACRCLSCRDLSTFATSQSFSDGFSNAMSLSAPDYEEFFYQLDNRINNTRAHVGHSRKLLSENLF